jgi:hypothetical protein
MLDVSPVSSTSPARCGFAKLPSIAVAVSPSLISRIGRAAAASSPVGPAGRWQGARRAVAGFQAYGCGIDTHLTVWVPHPSGPAAAERTAGAGDGLW